MENRTLRKKLNGSRWTSFLQRFSIECSKTKVLTLANRKGAFHCAKQTPKQMHVADAKRGKTSAIKSRFVLFIILIGWQSGARFWRQSITAVTLNESKYVRHSTLKWNYSNIFVSYQQTLHNDTYHMVPFSRHVARSSKHRPALSCDIQWRTSFCHSHKLHHLPLDSLLPQGTHIEPVLSGLSRIWQRTSHSLPDGIQLWKQQRRKCVMFIS